MLDRGAFRTDELISRSDRQPNVELGDDRCAAEVFSHEADHRLRNLVAVMSAITRRTLNRSDSDRALAETLSLRFAAIAAANNVLIAGSRCADICDVVADALAPFGLSWDDRILIAGPNLVIDPAFTVSLRMVLHELATNAVKHGALADNDGRLMVSWSCPSSDPVAFAFCWEERCAAALEPPDDRGFGTAMISRVLARHVDAPPEAVFHPSGIRFQFKARALPEMQRTAS